MNKSMQSKQSMNGLSNHFDGFGGIFEFKILKDGKVIDSFEDHNLITKDIRDNLASTVLGYDINTGDTGIFGENNSKRGLVIDRLVIGTSGNKPGYREYPKDSADGYNNTAKETFSEYFLGHNYPEHINQAAVPVGHRHNSGTGVYECIQAVTGAEGTIGVDLNPIEENAYWTRVYSNGDTFVAQAAVIGDYYLFDEGAGKGIQMWKCITDTSTAPGAINTAWELIWTPWVNGMDTELGVCYAHMSNYWISTQTAQAVVIDPAEGNENWEKVGKYTIDFRPTLDYVKTTAQAPVISSYEDDYASIFNGDESTIKIVRNPDSIAGGENIVRYSFRINKPVGNKDASGQDGTQYFTELALYANETLFAYKTFPQKIKSSELEAVITYTIIF